MMANTMNWYALSVKSRHEFVAYGELLKKEIETFLPASRRLRQWKDRKKWIDFPIFPGYLFVHVAPQPEALLKVLKTRGAVDLLSTQPGYPTPVPSEEIDSVRLLIESGTDFNVFPLLKEGTRVRVKRGPLTGAEGTLSTRNEQYLFLVTIELLGRSIGVNISGDDLEAA